jgi:protein-disulfide isomerase
MLEPNEDQADPPAGDANQNTNPETNPFEPVEQAVPQEEKPRRPSLVINVYSWATPVVGVLMLAIGLLAGYFGRPLVSGGGGQQAVDSASVSSVEAAPAAPAATADPTDDARRKEMMGYLVGQMHNFEGDENAPVTIIEFADFQCPFCGKFAAETAAQIEQKYVKTGKVRFGYWHFAFLGQESIDAAEASECAADQDAFWKYHDLLFQRQNGENKGTFAKDNLKQFATELNLDAQAFNDCLDSGKYTQLVQQLTQTAQSIGVRSTPAFLVNGYAIIGAQPYSVFQQAIDQELGKTSQ